jgi:hypothetical protein
LVELLKVLLLPNSGKPTKEVKSKATFRKVLLCSTDMKALCTPLLAFCYSKWVKIVSYFTALSKEIDRVIGFIIVLTKLLITFLQHITDA